MPKTPYTETRMRTEANNVLFAMSSADRPFTCNQVLHLCWDHFSSIIQACGNDEGWNSQFHMFWGRLPSAIKQEAWKCIGNDLILLGIKKEHIFEGKCLVFDLEAKRIGAYSEGGLRSASDSIIVIENVTSAARTLMEDWLKGKKWTTNHETIVDRITICLRKQGKKAVAYLKYHNERS